MLEDKVEVILELWGTIYKVDRRVGGQGRLECRGTRQTGVLSVGGKGTRQTGVRGNNVDWSDGG